MADNRGDNNVLISAARVVGAALGRVKRLTTMVSEPEPATATKKRTSKSKTSAKKSRKASIESDRTERAPGASKSTSKSRSKRSNARKTSVRKRSR